MAALLALAVILFVFMVFEAFTVALTGWVFLDLGFWDCWHAAWGKPWWLFWFALVSLVVRSWGN